MLSHGFNLSKNPILKPLNTIEQRDAVVNSDGTEPEWPAADVIVGNPPFLGDKKMLGGLGADYVTRLRKLYEGRVPGGADLVTYWFEKARAQIEAGTVRYAGLVATNSIRGGANRKVLDRIADSGAIFNAWAD
ncbi:class I SAM-dependent DNA methyltransferase, partial [bacterium]|nr:class I SAM-dependent DNA methyltransferase [bacterium]